MTSHFRFLMRFLIQKGSWLVYKSKFVDYFCSTSLSLASTKWVRSTFSSHCPLSSKPCHRLTPATSTIFSPEFFWQCWESNPGQLGLKACKLTILLLILLNLLWPQAAPHIHMFRQLLQLRYLPLKGSDEGFSKRVRWSRNKPSTGRVSNRWPLDCIYFRVSAAI